MNENQTSEPQHSIISINVRVLSPADAESYRFVRLLAVNLTVVTQQKAAICLYQSLGFHIYGTEQETFSKAGRFYDEHLMMLELTSDK
ncbi:MAG: hypothetical protein KME30_01325 [Iphinoe sp. HA4291-MV1]|jgi:RimJ/RimL family protein N-acetyltransferase|nr:hypothetical protein [Iphinoe sp. HA4291-MV1]